MNQSWLIMHRFTLTLYVPIHPWYPHAPKSGVFR